MAETPKRWRRARAAAATIVFIVRARIVATADGYEDVIYTNNNVRNLLPRKRKP